VVGITEASRFTGASTDELRYMERKGFLARTARRLKRREVRDYPETEVRKAKLIVKYRRLGFTWDAAFGKALEELANPPLFPIA
jgi:DNA-binding transcriptional MerR regulator